MVSKKVNNSSIWHQTCMTFSQWCASAHLEKTFLTARQDNYSNKILLFHRKTVGDSRSFFDHFFISWQPQICKLARHSSSLYFIFYSQVFFLLAANLTAAACSRLSLAASFKRFLQFYVKIFPSSRVQADTTVLCSWITHRVLFSLFFFFFVAPVACN